MHWHKVNPMEMNINTDKRNVKVAGEGEPTLVFVHGFGCTLDDWRAQIAALSPRFRCVALDLPGHGASAIPPAPLMAALASAVNAAKTHNARGPVILIGHSLGAKVIRDAYAQCQRDVAGLVFIEGALYRGAPDTVLAQARQAVDSAGFADFSQRHFGDMFVDTSDPQLRARVLARVLELDPDFGRGLYLEAVGWDAARSEQTLRQIKVPVLVLQSTYVDAQRRRLPLQPGITTPFMDAVKQLVPGAAIKVIAGCGHFLPAEAADAVNRELLTFIQLVSTSDHVL